jgi:hypothetical protein
MILCRGEVSGIADKEVKKHAPDLQFEQAKSRLTDDILKNNGILGRQKSST